MSPIFIKIKSFIKESIRVLKITKKPNMEELKTIVKITGLGMIVIGLIGFTITIAVQILTA